MNALLTGAPLGTTARPERSAAARLTALEVVVLDE
jgi:hypothetical protein